MLGVERWVWWVLWVLGWSMASAGGGGGLAVPNSNTYTGRSRRFDAQAHNLRLSRNGRVDVLREGIAISISFTGGAWPACI